MFMRVELYGFSVSQKVAEVGRSTLNEAIP